jgi:hypothetical protein
MSIPTPGFVPATEPSKPYLTNRPWGSVPATEQGLPHISLVFREMWDTTAVDRQSVGSTDKNIEKKSC